MNSILNVPEIKGQKKHKAIIEKIVDMDKDDQITLINDHDPKPLLNALDNLYPFTFKHQYLVSSPGDFKVKITRVTGISDFKLNEIAQTDINKAIQKISKVNTVKGQHYPLHFKHWTPDLWKKFITLNHHNYEIEATTDLTPIMDKVFKAHKKEIPELQDIQSVFDQLATDIQAHCQAQDELLNTEKLASVNQELNQLIERLNALTYGFTPPADSCPLTRTLYKRLEELCADITYHLFAEKHLVP